MPRHVSKTYGRADEGASTASQAFDNAVRRASGRDKVFGDVAKNTKMSTAMASSTKQRFGKAKFTSTRSSMPVIEPGELNRKRPAEDSPGPSLFDDPFSFDSDDDGPKRPKKGMGFQNSNNGKINNNKTVKSSSNESEVVTLKTKVAVPSNKEANGKFAAAANTYSLSKKTVSTDLSKEQIQYSNKQMSIDNYLTKTTTKSESVSSSSSSESNHKNWAQTLFNNDNPSKRDKKKSKKVMHKFFLSKNDDDLSCSPPDHTYSANLSMTQSQTRDDHCYSQPDRSVTDSPNKDIWGSDYDSDWDKESGDPEIVFNSPKKKALAAEPKSSVYDIARNIRREMNSSPITVSSETDENEVNNDAESLCSMTSAKSNCTEDLGDKSDDDDFGVSLKREVRSIRTYGKKSGASDSGVFEEAVSNSKSSSQDMYTGLTSRKGGVPPLKKFSSLEENTRKKEENTGKPLVRRLLTSPSKGGTKTKKAVYNARSTWQMASDGSSLVSSVKSSQSSSLFDDLDEDTSPPVKESLVLKRSVKGPKRPWDDAVSSLKTTRDQKPLFTVVRNVKQAHECQEHGETQEFQDEILYILDGLKNSEKISTRCLSTIGMATKCAMPSFRMHLRAHNTLTEVFSALQDAPKYPTLALCTALVMYMMSQDRINIDLDKTTLQLMLSLLSINDQEMAHSGNKADQLEYDRLCSRSQSIASSLKREGGVKNSKLRVLELQDITIGHLAMETLLSLTAKSAGDWFKEELRSLGGLDHIINTVSSCSEDLDDFVIEPTDGMLERFSKIDRCLRVLENVTYLNSENQSYLISYKSSVLISSLHRALRVCENCLPFNQVLTDKDQKVNKDCPGYIIYSCLLSILRVLLNLTHDNVVGSTKTGQTSGLVATVLVCILRVPQYIPITERFDILVLSLGLLINMVEHCDGNRRVVLDIKTSKPYSTLSVVNNQIPALESLSLLFNQCYDAARAMEEEHDAELEEREKTKDNHRVAPTPTLSQEDLHNKSGEWKESDSGLEWIVIPTNQDAAEDETDPEKILERGGTLREALRNHYNQDAQDEEGSSDGDELDVLTGSQEEDETFTKALHKYGRHMEDSIVAAYVALLLGCMVQGNSHLADQVRDFMPGCTFEGMIRMLKKFLGFMNFTSSSSNTGSKSIIRVIEMLEAHHDS